jgi:solute carrier family 25 phosphate transporter 23/24/25/41
MYDKIKEKVCKNINRPTTIERLVSGAGAGIISSTIIYPLEITKTRLAIAPPNTYSGILNTLSTIIRIEGYKALFKGWVPSVCGIIPYAAIDLAVFNTVKEMYTEKYSHDPSVTVLLMCGAFSGICG